MATTPTVITVAWLVIDKYREAKAQSSNNECKETDNGPGGPFESSTISLSILVSPYRQRAACRAQLQSAWRGLHQWC